MSDPYLRETVENWVSDFLESDAVRALPDAAREFAPAVLVETWVQACESEGRAPGDVGTRPVRAALLEVKRTLDLPPAAVRALPDLAAAFATDLEARGRLGGGRAIGLELRAGRAAFQVTDRGSDPTYRRPGAKVPPNSPCPCGSGRKFKKCCQA